MHALRLFSVLSLLIAGCAGPAILEMPVDPERELIRLDAALMDSPGDAAIMRDIGRIYLRTDRVPRAYEMLTQSYSRNDRDPATQFYLGIATEMVGTPETALQLYEKYPEAPRSSPYRRLLQGRYEWLNRKLAQDEMRSLVVREREIGDRFEDEGTGVASPAVVAVFPLAFTGRSSRFEALGRGLAEMLSVDLAAIHSLQLVERVRLQVLIDEMELGRSGLVDPATAPRMGRLLGAGRLVGGTYNVIRNQLHVDAGFVEMGPSAGVHQASVNDALSNVFALQKQLVFSLVETMGIELTQAERERIEYVPTQNLQAFLAYSHGLSNEDQGNFAAAASHYREASRLDPAFQEATVRAEAAESVVTAGGPPDDVLIALLQPPPIDPVNDRLQSLHENLGVHIIPGSETRKPAAEGLLPLPPPPPIRQ